MMLKRFSAVALTLGLLGSAMAGCSSQPEEITPPKGATVGTKQTANPGGPPAPAAPVTAPAPKTE